MALTDKQRRFVDEYLIDFNATAAYARAGYAARGNAAEVNGARLLRNAQVRQYLAERQKDLQARTEITQEKVLNRYWQIATADPNELAQYRRVCCHHCWGIDHAYQWTPAEYEAAQVKTHKREDPDPDDRGGLDYDITREPNPECPECRGRGIGRMHVNDTRNLHGAARLLYAGVKSGKDGLEVKMHDQMRALEAVARHIGFDRSRVEITGKDGAPVEVKAAGLDALKNLTDEQLAQLESIAAAVAGPGGDSGRESTPPSR